MRRRRRHFRLPHNIAISRDGFGTYVKEVFVSKRTLLQGAASAFALSMDPQQRRLYMIDGANHHVRRRRHLLGENFDARRFQRFLYKGIGTPKAGTTPTTTLVR